jgi:hypothetical protein
MQINDPVTFRLVINTFSSTYTTSNSKYLATYKGERCWAKQGGV